jgi:ubiquitin carboxyl-terminal hydrolase 16/45
MCRMDDFVSFPEKLDLAPYMAPDRNDYKTTVGPDGQSYARYMDFDAHGPKPDPVMYQLYGGSSMMKMKVLR